jgi:hypothetical protein
MAYDLRVFEELAQVAVVHVLGDDEQRTLVL